MQNTHPSSYFEERSRSQPVYFIFFQEEFIVWPSSPRAPKLISWPPSSPQLGEARGSEEAPGGCPGGWRHRAQPAARLRSPSPAAATASEWVHTFHKHQQDMGHLEMKSCLRFFKKEWEAYGIRVSFRSSVQPPPRHPSLCSPGPHSTILKMRAECPCVISWEG